MSSLQSESGRSVVEGPQFFPLANVVAGFAGFFRTVWIGVAGGAVLVDEMVLPGCRGGRFGERVMAVGASHSDVRSGERESGLAMTHQRVSRRPERVFGVAVFTAVLVRSSLKFAGMRVGVTVNAACRAHLVASLFAGRFVALDAIDLGVLPAQREATVLVLFTSEEGRFEAGLGMTRRTIASIRAPGELPAVDIVVAIATALVRHRLPEVGILVAF